MTREALTDFAERELAADDGFMAQDARDPDVPLERQVILLLVPNRVARTADFAADLAAARGRPDRAVGLDEALSVREAVARRR